MRDAGLEPRDRAFGGGDVTVQARLEELRVQGAVVWSVTEGPGTERVKALALRVGDLEELPGPDVGDVHGRKERLGGFLPNGGEVLFAIEEVDDGLSAEAAVRCERVDRVVVGLKPVPEGLAAFDGGCDLARHGRDDLFAVAFSVRHGGRGHVRVPLNMYNHRTLELREVHVVDIARYFTPFTVHLMKSRFSSYFAKKVQRLYDCGVKRLRRLNPARIRELREQRGLERVAVLRALEETYGEPVLHRHTLARWETMPLTSFDFNGITALAAYYGVNAEDLLEAVDPQHLLAPERVDAV